MAKTIKFNLICDGNPVRTLEDLRDNFSIEDVLNYYNNELLQRWLNVRGYNKELEMVEKLHGLDTLNLIKELIVLFGVEVDPISIEENTYILKYKKETEYFLEEYKNMDFKVSAIIDDYHTGYKQLIDSIIENKNDIAKIKSAIKEIDKKYYSLYLMDYRGLFYTFLEFAPLAIFVMLMNENMRKKYLPILTKDQNGNIVTVTEDFSFTYDSDKSKMYEEICNFLNNYNKLIEILGENLREFSGATDGYWKDVEPKGKKYLILSMQVGNYIRSAGVSGGDLSSTDINKNFMIIEGIDYKSNNSKHKLLYMEV